MESAPGGEFHVRDLKAEAQQAEDEANAVEESPPRSLSSSPAAPHSVTHEFTSSVPHPDF